jgi:hypothetical protein
MLRPIRVFAVPAAFTWLVIATACSVAPVADRMPPRSAAIALSVAGKPGPPIEPAPVLRAAPESVYRNPKIGVVYLRAHQDTEGRLLGPQIMYQVTEPGGWNVEAADQGNGYVPAVNLEAPASLASPDLVPARPADPIPANVPLLDADALAHISITGLMKPEDKAQAEAMARHLGGGYLAVYDDQAGWLIMPLR